MFQIVPQTKWSNSKILHASASHSVFLWKCSCCYFSTTLWHSGKLLPFYVISFYGEHIRFHFLDYLIQHQTKVPKAISPYCPASSVPGKALLSNDFIFVQQNVFYYMAQSQHTAFIYFFSVVCSVILDTSLPGISNCWAIHKLYWLNFWKLIQTHL